jgi:hypothetical protein
MEVAGLEVSLTSGSNETEPTATWKDVVYKFEWFYEFVWARMRPPGIEECNGSKQKHRAYTRRNGKYDTRRL